MGWDIHGNQLRPGFCEVHPWVALPYPCPTCHAEAAESEALRDAQDAYYNAEMNAAYEDAHLAEVEAEHPPFVDVAPALAAQDKEA